MSSDEARQRRDFRHELVAIRKELAFIDELVMNAKLMSLGEMSLHEVRQRLSLAEAMAGEVVRQLHELTAGYPIERPTVEEVRRLFEARRRVPRHHG